MAGAVGAEALLALADTLGIERDVLTANEGARDLSLLVPVPAERIARLEIGQLTDVFEALGSSATIEVRTGDLPELTCAGTVDTDAFDKLVTEAARSAGATYDVLLRVDKAQLANDLRGGRLGGLVVYVRTATFVRALEAGPASFEREVWLDPSARLVVVLLDDDDLKISGACMSVLGAGHADQAAGELDVACADALDRIARRREDYIGWDSALDTQLTPRHFAPHRDEGALRALSLEHHVVAALVGNVVALAALYLCDRARTGADAARVEFRGREHSAIFSVPFGRPVVVEDVADVTAQLGIVDWCYQPTPERPDADLLGDRLPWVQTRLAQVLESHPEDNRFEALVRNMPAVFTGVQWHWRSFVQGKVTDYLDQVRQVEAAVGDAVRRYADGTNGLVKRLSDAALATIAAAVASFLAATYKDPFNDAIFRAGMYSYAAYILLFPLAIGLLAVAGDREDANRSFAGQRSVLEETIDPTKVAEIVGERVDKARDRLNTWMRATAVIYVAIVIIAIVAAVTVPGMVHHEPSSTTSTTTVPTSLPANP